LDRLSFIYIKSHLNLNWINSKNIKFADYYVDLEYARIKLKVNFLILCFSSYLYKFAVLALDGQLL